MRFALNIARLICLMIELLMPVCCVERLPYDENTLRASIALVGYLCFSRLMACLGLHQFETGSWFKAC